MSPGAHTTVESVGMLLRIWMLEPFTRIFCYKWFGIGVKHWFLLLKLLGMLM